MCLIAFAVDAHPRYRLVLAANRDEWFERPTAPAHFWRDHPEVVGGRDLQEGGTWLGLRRDGRFAALTNFRDPMNHRAGAPSRGQLVARYLTGASPPSAFTESLQADAAAYNGYNILFGSVDALTYFSNQNGAARTLGRGVFGLSNHLLDSDWPKVRRVKLHLARLLEHERIDPVDAFAALADPQPAADHELPQTGIGLPWERALSSPLIRATARPGASGTAYYGTRSTCVLLVERDGATQFIERTYDVAGEIVGVSSERFRLTS